MPNSRCLTAGVNRLDAVGSMSSGGVDEIFGNLRGCKRVNFWTPLPQVNKLLSSRLLGQKAARALYFKKGSIFPFSRVGLNRLIIFPGPTGPTWIWTVLNKRQNIHGFIQRCGFEQGLRYRVHMWCSNKGYDTHFSGELAPYFLKLRRSQFMRDF